MTRQGQWPFKGYRVSSAGPVRLELSGGVVEDTDMDLLQFSALRLANVEFRDCALSQLQATAPMLVNVVFAQCQIEGVRLRGGTIRDMTVSGGLFADVTVADATIDGMTLTAAEASAIGLEQVRLKRATATDTRLSSVQLEECHIESLTCTGCTLHQVRASGGVFDTVRITGGEVVQGEWSHVVVGTLALHDVVVRSFRFGEGSVDECTIAGGSDVTGLAMIAQTVGRVAITSVKALVEPSFIGCVVSEVSMAETAVHGPRFARSAVEHGVRFEACTVEGLDLAGASLTLGHRGGKLAGPQQVDAARIGAWTLAQCELDASVKLVGTPAALANVDAALMSRR